MKTKLEELAKKFSNNALQKVVILFAHSFSLNDAVNIMI